MALKRDERLISAGQQMSNVFYNLKQRGDGKSNIHLAANEYANFGELQTEWDAALKEYRQSFERNRGR